MGTTGTLVIAATPIGRVSDASAQLAIELRAADIVAAEDTRRLRRLTGALGVDLGGRTVSYFDGNEERRTPQLVEALVSGSRVLLVCDAGMPSVSDPGYRLVSAAIAAGVVVTAVPGPSAVLTALAVSGLPVDRFCFEGFLPRKAGERTHRLELLRLEPRTLVFFEAPHRTPATLAAMAEVFGPGRKAAACRELTKTHEEVRRGRLDELVEWARTGVRGEVTLVVGGAEPASAAHPDTSAVTALVAEAQRSGRSRRDAVAAVAAETGLPRRVVYAAAHGEPRPRKPDGPPAAQP